MTGLPAEKADFRATARDREEAGRSPRRPPRRVSPMPKNWNRPSAQPEKIKTGDVCAGRGRPQPRDPGFREGPPTGEKRCTRGRRRPSPRDSCIFDMEETRRSAPRRIIENATLANGARPPRRIHEMSVVGSSRPAKRRSLGPTGPRRSCFGAAAHRVVVEALAVVCDRVVTGAVGFADARTGRGRAPARSCPDCSVGGPQARWSCARRGAAGRTPRWCAVLDASGRSDGASRCAVTVHARRRRRPPCTATLAAAAGRFRAQVFRRGFVGRWTSPRGGRRGH